VTVGRQSISRVVVEGGLEAGDRIALRDPSETPSSVFGGEEGAAGTTEPTP
jgi:hypothetical protein